MIKFETQVQEIRNKVLSLVAKAAFEGNLAEAVLDMPKKILPGKTATLRCCVYKERAILQERIRLAMGGNRENPSIVEVIDIACDECPDGGYEITNACRGCIAHRCMEACPRNAISLDRHQKAHIDKVKCVECGRCSQVCPYHAVLCRKRPCENACKANAIHVREDKVAYIEAQQCVSCGACINQCPFGAIGDKSHMLQVIALLKDRSNAPLYAIFAPAMASQFVSAKLGQVVTGIKQLGFTYVMEVAQGADLVACSEAQELAEKGLLTSSCCPSFVDYVNKQFPQLKEYVSHNPSPMVVLAKEIKRREPLAKVVFIGPCVSKKVEAMQEAVRPWVDGVLTFEELQAMFDARALELASLPDEAADSASYHGRIFARSGGLSAAVAQALREQDIAFSVQPVICDGLESCQPVLQKLARGRLDGNFVEGMACAGGCIGGAGCINFGPRRNADLEKYAKGAGERPITAAYRDT